MRDALTPTPSRLQTGGARRGVSLLDASSPQTSPVVRSQVRATGDFLWAVDAVQASTRSFLSHSIRLYSNAYKEISADESRAVMDLK